MKIRTTVWEVASHGHLTQVERRADRFTLTTRADPDPGSVTFFGIHIPDLTRNSPIDSCDGELDDLADRMNKRAAKIARKLTAAAEAWNADLGEREIRPTTTAPDLATAGAKIGDQLRALGFFGAQA